MEPLQAHGNGKTGPPGPTRPDRGRTPKPTSHFPPSQSENRSIWAVVLAAGRSSRFGAVKALMPIGGRTALATILAVARRAGAAGVVVVTGHHRSAVAPVVAAGQAIECPNPDPDRGMMSSVRVGVGCLPAGAAALIWPVDHPFVRSATVRHIIAALQTSPDRSAPPIVVPCYAGRGGHPTLFPADLCSALLVLDDTGGPDRLLRQHANRVLWLPVADPGVRRDIDRPTDLSATPSAT